MATCKTMSDNVQKLNPIIARFPLVGQWIAPHTPGSKIPSHGTDQLGQTYAYDFLRLNERDGMQTFHSANRWRYRILGVPLSWCFCWGEPVLAPIAGTIIQVWNVEKERQVVHFVRDMSQVLWNALFFDPSKHGWGKVLGNHIILACPNGQYVLLAHLKTGSVIVKKGQQVQAGQLLAQVGHSGNSTAPHLHFQVMDSSELMTAKGIPCVFERYERLKDGAWEMVCNTWPKDTEQIRFRDEKEYCEKSNSTQ